MNVRPPAPLITKVCPCGAEFTVRDTPTERKRVYCAKNCPEVWQARLKAGIGSNKNYHRPAAKAEQTCVHHWQLDGLSRGTCQHCGETKDFGWRVGA